MVNGGDVIQLVHEGILAVGTALGGWILMFPLRTAVTTIRTRVKILDELKEELVEQRTNCLKTLQEQGEKQIELLSKAVETLEDIHVSQAEMTGFIKGQKG
jgi:hypothetical protein